MFIKAYHFTTIDSALKILRNKTLKISRFNELNDPFELLSANVGDKNIRCKVKGIRDKVINSKGIISFSKSWKNPVQWAHYADRHKGVCLSFNIEKSLLTNVNYHAGRLEFSTNPTLEKILSSKFNSWKYEQETRMIIDLKDPYTILENGLHFIPFSGGLILKKIIFGANTRSDEIRKIYNLSNNHDDLEFVQARPAFKTFTMTPKKDWNIVDILS
ncbi:DUF2971 domain-containing protein [Citrobacter portucalensis]|uniref:DUF2971 domain-containing protein n=1 Tax=Citrobacter portucalensis TaxID=1639133 RepID=UPI0039FDBC90